MVAVPHRDMQEAAWPVFGKNLNHFWVCALPKIIFFGKFYYMQEKSTFPTLAHWSPLLQHSGLKVLPWCTAEASLSVQSTMSSMFRNWWPTHGVQRVCGPERQVPPRQMRAPQVGMVSRASSHWGSSSLYGRSWHWVFWGLLSGVCQVHTVWAPLFRFE